MSYVVGLLLVKPKWSHLGLDKFLQLANIVYMVSALTALAMTFVIYQLSVRVNAAKDRELEKYQNESTIKITDAQAEAAEAIKIAESNRLARAELEAQVAVSDARAAEANAAAAQAQLELAKFKEPRTIAEKDQEKIITSLKEFSGQNFGFAVFPDPEPLALLGVLNAMLKSAGWLRMPSLTGSGISISTAGNTAATTLGTGVFAVVDPDNRDAFPALRALRNALYAAGIPCRIGPADEKIRDKTSILIMVGKKP